MSGLMAKDEEKLASVEDERMSDNDDAKVNSAEKETGTKQGIPAVGAASTEGAADSPGNDSAVPPGDGSETEAITDVDEKANSETPAEMKEFEKSPSELTPMSALTDTEFCGAPASSITSSRPSSATTPTMAQRQMCQLRQPRRR